MGLKYAPELFNKGTLTKRKTAPQDDGSQDRPKKKKV